MNDWALITGATSGIGLELARILAANHYNLVIVARHEDRLNEVARELRSRHGSEVKVVRKDLAFPGAPQELFDALRDTPVSVLVNNAAFGLYGPFAKNDLRVQTDIMRVNMTALVELTHLFVQPMLARRSGRILNVASMAAFQPGPTVNVYYASKAFVHSFSYALAMELDGTGVTVTTLCPGTTRTEFFKRAKMTIARDWMVADPRSVAQAGYRGMMLGKRVVIPGLLNQMIAFLGKRVPVCMASAAARKMHQPK